jgi:hypothetical protein
MMELLPNPVRRGRALTPPSLLLVSKNKKLTLSISTFPSIPICP